MDNRERILDAAARLFQELGSRGATTRRIAAAAGVNEVTLFRQFGSKQQLLSEALARASRRSEALPALPAEPRDPERELRDWCGEQLRRLYQVRSLIRRSMAEYEEHPEAGRRVSQFPHRVQEELRQYLERLVSSGLASADLDLDAAVAMLVGALFADAMSRDIMPERFHWELEEAAGKYVHVFTRMLGSPQPSAAPRRRRNASR